MIGWQHLLLATAALAGCGRPVGVATEASGAHPETAASRSGRASTEAAIGRGAPATAGSGDVPASAPRAWYTLSAAELPNPACSAPYRHVAGAGVVLVVRPVDHPGLARPRAQDGPVLDWTLAGGPAPRGAGHVVAASVVAAVRRRMVQRRVVARWTPAESWARAEGDCTELADVAAALLRGLGWEARVVAGVVAHDGALRYHAWVELAAETGWWPLDPALGAVPAGVDHLALDCGPTSGSLPLLEQIGPALSVQVSLGRPAPR